MSKANHIMVLYTGGTIGMQASANGLAPASGFEARMREQLAHLPAPTWRFREMAPLIDSANMTPAYWQRLRSAVVEAVDEGCDAVLILHGTDTLAYSAAAMSFNCWACRRRWCSPARCCQPACPTAMPGKTSAALWRRWATAWHRVCTCTSTAH